MYEYFEIFLGRMMMCRGAAEVLGATFKLTEMVQRCCRKSDFRWIGYPFVDELIQGFRIGIITVAEYTSFHDVLRRSHHMPRLSPLRLQAEVYTICSL